MDYEKQKTDLAWHRQGKPDCVFKCRDTTYRKMAEVWYTEMGARCQQGE